MDMAKRFIDTDLFKKDFIRSLEGSYKLLWIYICLDCNHAGIWEIELDVANVRLQTTFELEDAKKAFKDKIQIIDNGSKWFIPSFIDFQYGQLNKENRAHASVILILRKYGLINNKGLIKGVVSPLQGAMDMDKDMDKVKELDKDKDKDKEKDGSFEVFWNFYNKKNSRYQCLPKWNRLSQKDQDDIMKILPIYIDATPDIKFRKNPVTFLNQRYWEDVEGIKQMASLNNKDQEPKKEVEKGRYMDRFRDGEKKSNSESKKISELIKK